MKTKQSVVNVDADINAMEMEILRLTKKLEDNRKAPKYDARHESYDAFFSMQGRLSRQLEAAKDAIRIYSRIS